jgi:hypothetical protein
MTTNNMITETVYIETQLETLTTFGIRVATGEQVFINAKVARKYGIEEDQTRELTMLPNYARSHEDTPWKAVGVSIADASASQPRTDEAPTPRVEVAKLEDRILEYFNVEVNQFAHKAKDLAQEFGEEDLYMQKTLSRMHMSGEIAKAQVWAKGTQEKASFVLWAPETSWFSL